MTLIIILFENCQ